MTPANRDKLLSQIAAVIRKNKTFFLSGHRKPDGDTVASELAMASLLKRLGKKVEVWNAEPVPESLLFLPGARAIKHSPKVGKSYDVAVIFECVDADRMGNVIDLKTQAKTVINIDHHIHFGDFGHINMVDVKASSNSEQLVYLFEELKMRITPDEANALYAGVTADTGRFQHSNTTAETFRIAAKLVESGARPHIISERLFTTRSHSSLKLLGWALSNLKTAKNDKVAYLAVSSGDFDRLGSNEEELEDIVNYGLQIPTVLISILAREPKSGADIKASLRARRGVDVCKIAMSFGGGGHKYASGCKIRGSLDEAMRKLLSAATARV
ncbi:MAG: hypothetical protein A3A86_01155 [Elusimicrobia bacterium RIFCSPLOWO2_01_FULL_60_11]|nr:MAG: hypothetical protein A3A86_01155 [Elusimicrobia bacterium RIFCSPLOWO2_01_FULL_60_11]